MAEIVTSVVVPIHNNGDVVDALMASLAEQDFGEPWEVVVADNRSTDNSRERVLDWEGHIPNLRLVDASAVRGVSHARNRAAEEARGEFLLYVDADDVVTEGWVAALTSALRDYDLATGPYDEESLNDRFARVWAKPHRPKDTFPTVFGFLPTALGNNFGIRASVLRELGGWDEEYLYGEDVELSWRAQLAGYSLGFVPKAVVRYRHRGDIRGLARQQFFRAHEGHYLYRDFAVHGYQPPSVVARSIQRLALLVAYLPFLPFSRTVRGLWMKHAAYGWGWFRAAIEGKQKARLAARV